MTGPDVERTEYYLTPISTDILTEGKVKLGVKYTLKNGEVHGNAIEIPFYILNNLVQDCKE